ncbi:MAG TPA: TerC family protein [Pseudolabrys sp.]|jgi:YjbE family integral membrane protein|uniref:TerC family protein n=1 Tax=Pseudolabrys sp. TaxID=1960880 RepID=UPI002DDCA95F|nr:TerC family protein [Pseudolabrys sp.]HEV2628971.1 TerC family protein [Pseudolabrys sp.]
MTLPFDITHQALAALFQVIVIDLVLAGDNAVVIGIAAAGLPRQDRTRAILVGIAAATILRILFAGVAVEMLSIVGLVFAGGILLLWVCWKMWRELRAAHQVSHDEVAAAQAHAPRKTLKQAAWQIVVADVSMSLDNVLAVAGAAREHPWALVFGLGLSIVLMGVAANLVARLLGRHRWIAYIGLAIVLYVALDMIWRGFWQIEALAGG